MSVAGIFPRRRRQARRPVRAEQAVTDLLALVPDPDWAALPVPRAQEQAHGARRQSGPQARLSGPQPAPAPAAATRAATTELPEWEQEWVHRLAACGPAQAPRAGGRHRGGTETAAFTPDWAAASRISRPYSPGNVPLPPEEEMQPAYVYYLLKDEWPALLQGESDNVKAARLELASTDYGQPAGILARHLDRLTGTGTGVSPDSLAAWSAKPLAADDGNAVAAGEWPLPSQPGLTREAGRATDPPALTAEDAR